MDEKVLDRAVEAGERGLLAFREQLAAELSRGDESSFRGTNDETRQRNVRVVVEAAVPVIVEAAVKEAKARVEAAAEAFDGQRDRANWNDPFREGKAAGFRAALAAIDKEGEGEVNTTEEEGDRG